MKNIIKGIPLLLWLLLSTSTKAQVFFDGPPFPPKLSAWGVLTINSENGKNTLGLGEGVVPYDLNTPLFTDYAHKFRTLWLPVGTTAQYREEGPLDFPVGTVISKTFAYQDSTLIKDGLPVSTEVTLKFDKELSTLVGHHLLETRILVHTSKGWVGLPYIWNEEQSEANLAITGKNLNLTWTNPQGKNLDFIYSIPNMNQCKSCHISINGFQKKMRPIGPTASNLNRDYSYQRDGVAENQLVHWKKNNLLAADSPLPTDRLPVWNDPATGPEAERARAYLDVNCSHCHNPTGLAKTSKLFLEKKRVIPVEYGICKSPVAVGNAGGGLPFDIFPGRPEKSILIYRMDSRKPEIMMPEMGRNLIHEEGVELVKSWIAHLEGVCSAVPPESTP